MTTTDRLFLTVDQAVDAIQRDLEQYPIQWHLVASLVPIVFGDGAYVTGYPTKGTIWLKTPDQKTPILVDDKQIRQRIIHRLKAAPPTSAKLSEICTRVFQTSAIAAQQGALSGVSIETGMDRFDCLQCGRCCRSLDYRDGCSLEDYRRWQRLGRTDILRWVGVINECGQAVACRIWMVPGTNRFADACPWLKRGDRPDRYVCTIHDVRPSICRQYPGSRKHARLTGCMGV